MDADIERLILAERLREAATLAEARGDLQLAAELYERDCLFAEAGRAALRGNLPERALLLACEAHDDDTAESALADLDDARLPTLASALSMKGHHGWAARLFEAIGQGDAAATAWSRAGREERAADILEHRGDPAAAARELEAGLRRVPERWDLKLRLGRLLDRHGRREAAIRALQEIPKGAAERGPATMELARIFGAMNLGAAQGECLTELAALGFETSPPSQRPAAMARDEETFFGRYRRKRDVASTANARVIECIDTLTEEHVALKVFAGNGLRGVGRDALVRFEREVTILRGLRHPSVVPLREYVPEGPALVLAWMSGGSLAEMLAKEPLAPARAVEIAAAVLDALSAAHRAGVIHRDVKPSNVLFDGAGAARLADFGAAHLGDLAATATAGVIGTFAYMSPEQKLGHPATIQSDLYGVGAMLSEMLVGSAAAGTLPSALHRDLDRRHDAALAALLAKEPQARPADAAAARKLLLELRWPTSFEPVARPLPESAPELPAKSRLESLGNDLYRDEWTGRLVRLVPLTESTLTRARAFAQALAHVTGGLEVVLRVDASAAKLWIEAREGAPLDRPLTASESRRLGAVLSVLHQAGVPHGSVDRAHIRLLPREGAVLAFTAETTPTATPDLDLIALSELSRGASS